jgi:hypothetical protein
MHVALLRLERLADPRARRDVDQRTNQHVRSLLQIGDRILCVDVVARVRTSLPILPGNLRHVEGVRPEVEVTEIGLTWGV